jgi:phosphopantetheinyl transferase (holo-ACP synthase)
VSGAGAGVSVDSRRSRSGPAHAMNADRPAPGPIAGWPWLPDLASASLTPAAGPPATPCCADELVGLVTGPRTGTGTASVFAASDRSGALDQLGPRAERQPGGWACASACWLGDDELARTVDRYLSPDERALFEGFDDHGGRSWLAGRIAVKDAVCWWLADRHEVVSPADVVVATDTAGRPYLRSHGSAAAPYLAALDLRLSVAHLFGVGVAIVARKTPVGIRIEELVAGPRPAAPAPAAPVLGVGPCVMGGPAVEPGALGGGELADGEAAVLTACAREAAARCRASGTRAGGARTVTALGPDAFLVDDQLVRCVVLDPDRFCSQAGHPLVVGWTVTGEALDRRDDSRSAGIR